MSKWGLRRSPCMFPIVVACLAVAGCSTATSATRATSGGSVEPVPAIVVEHAPAPVPVPPTVPGSAREQLAADIGAFISQARFATAAWGISVVSLDGGQVLYSHRADKLAIPASNDKLFTAALALSTLGPRYRIYTSLYATARPRNGTLHGDLILYGRGDPTLGTDANHFASDAWADRLANAVARRGVRRVSGKLIADATYFTGPDIPTGWEARDLQTWFAPRPSALTVQGNMFVLDIGPENGLCCTIKTTPDVPGLHVVNLTQTDPAASHRDLGIYRPPGSSMLYAYGVMQPHAATRRFVLSVPDPARLAGVILLHALERHGVTVDGGVQVIAWPDHDAAVGAPGTVSLDRIASPPLRDILKHTLKHSDNLYAQLLWLQSGVRQAASGACPDRMHAPHYTAGWSRCAMRQLLRRIGITRDEGVIEEGSGLSRKDLVTPRTITRLLEWLSRRRFDAAFDHDLAVAGEDGTLRHRMRHTDAAGNVHAKTGTLQHSYTLSGYVTAASGAHLVFSLMLDNYIRPTSDTGQRVGPSPQHDLDAIALMLAGYGGQPASP